MNTKFIVRRLTRIAILLTVVFQLTEVGSLAQNDSSEMIITDQMTDDECRNYRNMKMAELEQR